MDYKVVVLSSAERDIATAIEYYSKINVVLPKNFLNKVEATYEILSHTPHFQKKYKNVRAVPITGFPYLFFYTIDENSKKVKVVSCFHTAQNPKRYPK